jgi:hypothetical protein
MRNAEFCSLCYRKLSWSSFQFSEYCVFLGIVHLKRTFLSILVHIMERAFNIKSRFFLAYVTKNHIFSRIEKLTFFHCCQYKMHLQKMCPFNCCPVIFISLNPKALFANSIKRVRKAWQQCMIEIENKYYYDLCYIESPIETFVKISISLQGNAFHK